ncbi:hypothetical protein TIFTF001_056029 [Ficus carica]|uniref:Uncharacterized protein n=1 Tax=Ficus carica TaxID=3494 RepID=A0AA88EER0_FICCA|nr:hypothetical protein TIFTF001_056029 [Ficus carica]
MEGWRGVEGERWREMINPLFGWREEWKERRDEGRGSPLGPGKRWREMINPLFEWREEWKENRDEGRDSPLRPTIFDPSRRIQQIPPNNSERTI